MKYDLHHFGTPGRGASRLLPDPTHVDPRSDRWLEDAIAATKERKRIERESIKWRKTIKRREQEARARALEALDGPAVEIPEALLDALLDFYYGEGWSHSSESSEIVSEYLHAQRVKERITNAIFPPPQEES